LKKKKNKKNKKTRKASVFSQGPHGKKRENLRSKREIGSPAQGKKEKHARAKEGSRKGTVWKRKKRRRLVKTWVQRPTPLKSADSGTRRKNQATKRKGVPRGRQGKDWSWEINTREQER